MPPKTQNSSYNGLDSDKIYIPYSTMVAMRRWRTRTFTPES